MIHLPPITNIRSALEIALEAAATVIALALVAYGLLTIVYGAFMLLRGPRQSVARPRYSEVQPIRNFVILCLVTHPLYEIYWLWASWWYLWKRLKPDMPPFWRVVFAPLLALSLPRRILDFAKEKGYVGHYSEYLLAIGYLLDFAAFMLPNPYSLVSATSFVFLLPAFRALNFVRYSEQPHLPVRQTLSRGEWFLLGLGGLLWTFLLLGMGRTMRIWF